MTQRPPKNPVPGPAIPHGLTPKQRHFTELMLAGETAAQAYRTAYSSHATPQTCARSGYALSKHRKVHAILEAAREKTADRTDLIVQKYAITKERVLEELARVAFADMRDIAGWDGKKVSLRQSDQLTDAEAAAVQEVYQSKSGVRVKLADKRAALVDLGRHLGLFNADQANAPVANLYNVVIK